MIVSSRADTKTLLRDHEVEHDMASGLLSLLGGKWTTYRLMAQDAIDRVGELINNPVPGGTENHFLVGGENYRFEDWETLQKNYGLPVDVCQHLMRTYGTRADRVAQLTRMPELAEKLIDSLPYLNAEVVYQVQEEMAVVLRDVLARRWRLELSDWQLTAQLAPQVASLMANELDWNDAYRAGQVRDYQNLLNTFIVQAGLKRQEKTLIK